MNKEQTEGQRHDILFTVLEGRNSKHWHYVRNYLLNMLSEKDKYLDTFKYVGMNDKNSKEYNDTLRDIYWIKRFIGINEEIAKDQETFLESIKKKFHADEMIHKMLNAGASFVGLFSQDKDNNGNNGNK